MRLRGSTGWRVVVAQPNVESLVVPRDREARHERVTPCRRHPRSKGMPTGFVHDVAARADGVVVVGRVGVVLVEAEHLVTRRELHAGSSEIGFSVGLEVEGHEAWHQGLSVASCDTDRLSPRVFLTTRAIRRPTTDPVGSAHQQRSPAGTLRSWWRSRRVGCCRPSPWVAGSATPGQTIGSTRSGSRGSMIAPKPSGAEASTELSAPARRRGCRCSW